MSYSFEKIQNVLVFHIDSLIDSSKHEEIISHIENYIRQGDNEFIIDLSRMPFINSSGLTFLISILTRARSAGGDVIITQISPKIKQVLIITRLQTVFTITPDLETALSHFEKIKEK